MEFKLKEVISREPTLLVLVIGVPNVGKSALINSIHQIASSRFGGKLLLCFLISMVGCPCLELNNNGFVFNCSAAEDEASYSWAVARCYSRYCWIQGHEILCFVVYYYYFLIIQLLKRKRGFEPS